MKSRRPLPEDEEIQRCCCLNRGLELVCMQYCYARDMVYEFKRKYAFLEFGCLLSGDIQGFSCLPGGERAGFGGQAGHTWVSYAQSAQGMIEYFSGKPICAVVFLVSGPLLGSFLPADDKSSHVPAPTAMGGSFNLVGSLDSKVEEVVRQILSRGDLPGELDRLFLVSKAYELLFQLLAFNQRSQNSEIRFAQWDCVERASNILKENLASPPSLPELARQSGLCPTNLNRGFKDRFGTTVFGFLRKQRLARARELMLFKQKSACEAAWEVGYASLSSFHRAFYTQYGVTPGSLIKKS